MHHKKSTTHDIGISQQFEVNMQAPSSPFGGEKRGQHLSGGNPSLLV